jgi:ribonuclease HI
MSAWKRYLFKNKSKVWVHVDDAGEPIILKGRVSVAYSKGALKLYLASLSNLGPIESPEIIDTESWGSAMEEASAAKPKTKKKPATKSKPGTKEPKSRRDAIKVYTDGACSGNPGPCSAAALLKFQGKELELSKFLGKGTNNVGELEAIRLGLAAIKDRDKPVDLFTDSTYVIGVLTLGWRAKANRQMISEIRALVEEFSDLRILKVKGHSGHPDNERVDQLAVKAIEDARN